MTVAKYTTSKEGILEHGCEKNSCYRVTITSLAKEKAKGARIRF